MMKKEMPMSIHDLCKLASRLQGMAYDAEVLAMTREELQQEIIHLARELLNEADEIDLEMDRQFVQEYA
jgi:hypothetical protein